jgi:hypothetical protein
MGVGYYKAVTQFSKGEYTGASNTQDDIKIIRGYLPNDPTPYGDDHGSTMATATPLPSTPLAADPTRAAAGTTGVIEFAGDADWFVFAAAAGPATLTVSITPNARANVDLRLQVWTAGAANPLASFDTVGALLAGPFAVALPADDVYYVSLTGVGDGADGATGYTSYGSLGAYKLAVEAPTGGPPLPSPAPPQPSPSPSPPPPPPAVSTVVLTLASTQLVYNTRKKTTVVKATLVASDQAGNPLKAAATISGTWASSSGSFRSTAIKVTTSSSTGQVVVTSPAAANQITTMTITGVSLAGYTWDKANSVSYKEFTF